MPPKIANAIRPSGIRLPVGFWTKAVAAWAPNGTIPQRQGFSGTSVAQHTRHQSEAPASPP